LHLFHGSPRRINEYLMEDRDERTYRRLAAQADADVLLFGHTHKPWHREYGGVLFVNVGSAGRPKDGDARAMYTVLRLEQDRPPKVEVRRVAYDSEETARGVLAVGLPLELAQAFRCGE
ncbi:MAG TPA: metallophosphoesterase family protein, partial [Thermoleophilia bacterium]|nr:metallophosphoesterase family protein [Thermoleophilia bacterium]